MLPIPNPAMDAVAPAKTLARSTAMTNIVTLGVDDNGTELAASSRLLRHHGSSVRASSSGMACR